jgi:hypothetical protein
MICKKKKLTKFPHLYSQIDLTRKLANLRFQMMKVLYLFYLKQVFIKNLFKGYVMMLTGRTK